MAKKQPPGFNNPPPGVRKNRAVLDTTTGTYRPLHEVAGKQPWYKYQSVGRVTAIPPTPVEGTPIAMNVGNYFNVFFGFGTTYGIGTIDPTELAGVTIIDMLWHNSTAPLRSEIITNSGVQIDGRESLTYKVDDLHAEYTIGWSVDKYIHDSQDTDPDHQAWADLLAYIMSKDGQDITITFLNL